MAQQQSQSWLYSILIILFGIGLGWFYYAHWGKPNEAAIAPSPIGAQDGLTAFKNAKLDFSTLDGAAYKNLQVFGDIPVKPGPTGKRDIFSPI